MSFKKTGMPVETKIKAGAYWRRIEVYHRGDDFFNSLESEINKARHTIYLESYIFAFDRLGQRILDTLGLAVARGVQVKVVIDGIGSSWWANSLREKSERLGIQLKVFHELPWNRWRRGKVLALRRIGLSRAIQRINNRNHRKVCIIDHARAFVGSMNIIEYHSESFVGDTAWRDTGVLVEGDEVALLVESFHRLWSKKRGLHRIAGRKIKHLGSGELIRLNSRRAQRQDNYLDLLVRIIGAKQRIWIESAYFVPDGSLVRALSVAAQAGVDVKIVVPANADVFFIPWVTSAFHVSLLKAGVRVFEYTKCMMHAKTLLIDDWGVVGSSNLNHRSLLHDLEADVVLADVAGCLSLETQFQLDCRDAKEITLANWKSRSVLERWIGWLLLLFRRIL